MLLCKCIKYGIHYKHAPFRYRYYVFDGELSASEAERAWRDYAHPPDVKIKMR